MKGPTKILLAAVLTTSLFLSHLLQARLPEDIEGIEQAEITKIVNQVSYNTLRSMFIPKTEVPSINAAKIRNEAISCIEEENPKQKWLKGLSTIGLKAADSFNCTKFYDQNYYVNEKPDLFSIEDSAARNDFIFTKGANPYASFKLGFGASSGTMNLPESMQKSFRRSDDYCECVNSRMKLSSRMDKKDIIKLQEDVDKYIKNSKMKLQADMFNNLVEGLDKTINALSSSVGPQQHCSMRKLQDIYTNTSCPTMKESLAFAKDNADFQAMYNLDRFPLGLYESVVSKIDNQLQGLSIRDSIISTEHTFVKITNNRKLPPAARKNLNSEELISLSTQLTLNPKLSRYRVRIDLSTISLSDRDLILSEVNGKIIGNKLVLNHDKGEVFAVDEITNGMASANVKDVTKFVQQWGQEQFVYEDFDISTACGNQKKLLQKLCNGVNNDELKALTFGNINVLGNLISHDNNAVSSDITNYYGALQCIQSGKAMENFVSNDALQYLLDKDNGFFPTREAYASTGSDFSTGHHIVDKSYKNYIRDQIELNKEEDAEAYVSNVLSEIVSTERKKRTASNRVRKSRGLPPLDIPSSSRKSSTETRKFTTSAPKPTSTAVKSSSALVQSAVIPQTRLAQLPAISTQAAKEINKQMSELEESTQNKSLDGKISSYEARLASLMKQLEAKDARAAKAVSKSSNQDVADDEEEELSPEMAQLTNHISKLKGEISKLKEKKKKSAVAKAIAPTTTPLATSSPFSLGGNPTSSNQGQASRGPASVPGTPSYSTPTSSNIARSSSSGPSKDSYRSASSQQKSSTSGLTLTGKTIESYNPIEIPVDQFDISNQAYMQDLFEKTNGRPVVITRTNNKGEVEQILYEAVKGKDGKIKYVEKKVEKKKGKEVKRNIASKKKKGKVQMPRRKRLTVEELNELIKNKTK